MLKKIKSFSEIDKKKINSVLGQVTRTSTLDRFKRGKSPEGKRWQTSIRAAAEGGKTLIKTAQLRNSIRTKSDVTGFALGTNVKYGATHQYGEEGRTIRARRAKALRFRVGEKWITKKAVKINIPARPYLGLSDEDMQEIKATVEEFVSRGD
jgi:phage gpG-like protein